MPDMLTIHPQILRKTQSYYASIDHQLLLDRLALYIPDRQILNLIAQYLKRCAERGGLFWEYKKGIAGIDTMLAG